MKKLLARLCLAAVLFKAPSAFAEADTFGLGNAREGALVVNSTKQINLYASVTAPLAPGDTTLTVERTAGFEPEDLVMVIQSTGLVPEPASGRTVPLNLTQDAVGRFELARVRSASNSTLVLTAPLVHSYAASVTQVVRVPEYTTVNVTPLGVLEAAPWDGHTGGVLAFLATQTVTNQGHISVTGVGFQGAQASQEGSDALACSGLDEAKPLGADKGEGVASTRFGTAGRGNAANGGGGGVCLMAGGGGGGNGGNGGQGGYSHDQLDGTREVGGQGGVEVDYDELGQLIFGGGGGAGHVGLIWGSTESEGDSHSGQGHDDHGNGHGYGHCQSQGQGHDEDECQATTGIGGKAGSGGGVLFMRAAQLAGSGFLEADGANGGNGVDSGGSGGGAGGIIHARFTGSAVCAAIRANGGMGGHSNASPAHAGPGGGGGGGHVLFQSSNSGTRSCPISVVGGGPGSALGSIGIDPRYGAQSAADGTFRILSGPFRVPQEPSIEVMRPDSCDLRPIFKVTTVAGAKVALFLDGKQLVQAQADSTGQYSFTPTEDLSRGDHQVSAWVELLGARSPRSQPQVFTLGCTPRIPPIADIELPASGTLTNDATPTITGTASPGSTVSVAVDTIVVGTVTAGADGRWSLEPETAIPDGPHEVTAVATNAEGTGPTSTAHDFIVDTTPPDTFITQGPSGQTLDTSASFEFLASEPDVTFECAIDGADFAPCDSSLKQENLAPGNHIVRVRATDAAHNPDPTPAEQEWRIEQGERDSLFEGGGMGCASSGGGASLLGLLWMITVLMGTRKH